jgi:hypothetical protein
MEQTDDTVPQELAVTVYSRLRTLVLNELAVILSSQEISHDEEVDTLLVLLAFGRIQVSLCDPANPAPAEELLDWVRQTMEFQSNMDESDVLDDDTLLDGIVTILANYTGHLQNAMLTTFEAAATYKQYEQAAWSYPTI